MHMIHLTSSSICNGTHNSFLLLIFFLPYYYIVEKYHLENWIRKVIYQFVHLKTAMIISSYICHY